MATETEHRTAIVVERIQITKEKPPKDAVPVESLQVEEDGEWKKILAMHMWLDAVRGHRPVRLLVKFWVEEVES